MRSHLSYIAALHFQLIGACAYEFSWDGAGDDRAVCWEYGEERFLSCDAPTNRGPTPAEFMESHASPAHVAGELDTWFDGDRPSFSFAFDADISADCREVGWPSWEVVPERCRGKWELVLRTRGQLAIEHAALPPVSGSGAVSIEDDGTQWSCLAFLNVTLVDEGEFVAWFDFVETHMAEVRPRRVDVYIRSHCDGSEGVVHVSYEAAVGDLDVSEDRFFTFEN